MFNEVEGRNTADYLMRTAQQHHVQLSAMADAKANILITVSSIVLTLTISQLSDPVLRWSLLTLSGFTLFALLMAVLTVLPKFDRVKTKESELSSGFNLLFFGHFAFLSQERFLKEMEKVLVDDSRIYEVLAKDLYNLGYYLYFKKYRYLRYSYFLLLAGFIVAPVQQMVMILLY